MGSWSSDLEGRLTLNMPVTVNSDGHPGEHNLVAAVRFGVCGERRRAKTREERPGLDDMLKRAQRREFDVVMAWAIDRIGRSLIDLLNTIETLKAVGVDLYLDQQAIDTTTPTGKLMLQMTGAFAEFEAT